LNRILLLEDDPVLQKSLAKLLAKEGFDVDCAFDANEAVDLSYENSYDLYLFDINVPVQSGDSLLKELRDSGDRTPAIIITALIDIDSVKRGFDAGADDYIKKPFEIDELIIRVKSKIKQSMVKVGKFSVDFENSKVYQDGIELALGGVLKDIFLHLAKAYPNYLSKYELLELLGNSSDGALRVNISKLKKQLGIDIENKRGVGYKIIWKRVFNKEFYALFSGFWGIFGIFICALFRDSKA